VLTINDTAITQGAEYQKTELEGKLYAFTETFALAVRETYKGAIINGTDITLPNDDGMWDACVQPATSRANNVGVAKTAGAEGETVDVYCVNEA
jgi:hypothetical protein